MMKKKPIVNALVFDRSNLNDTVLEDLDGPWYDYGTATISLCDHDADGNMVPWEPRMDPVSKDLEIRTPGDMYEALDWEVLRAVYWVNTEWWKKVNTGLMVALLGLLLFFAYLIYANQTGG